VVLAFVFLWTFRDASAFELLKLVGRIAVIMMSAGMWDNQICFNYGFGFKVGML
jgi:hypothetical protein